MGGLGRGVFGLFMAVSCQSPKNESAPTPSAPPDGPGSSVAAAQTAPSPSPSPKWRPPSVAAPASSESRPAPAPSVARRRRPGSNQQVTRELQEELHAFVAKRQACTSTSQCTLVGGGRCPFGCSWPVARSAAGAVRAKLSEVNERNRREGGELCDYMCMPAIVACQRGRCTALKDF